MATTAPNRIQSLDVVRGIAVMGILAMNIVAFGMPWAAYINPFAYGADSAVDLGVYAFNAIFVDGKMRGLFSFLFGASMLLVIQLAEAKDADPKGVTFRRQLWLLAFGMMHYYLIWYGDILIGYALIGMLAWLFRDRSVKGLIGWGIALLVVQLLIMSALATFANSLAASVAAGNASADELKTWQEMTVDVAVPSAAALREDMALHLGPWIGIVHEQVTDRATMPFFFLFIFGWETLAYMLFGMAALKSGFLTGAWDKRRYWKTALLCLAISVPAMVTITAMLFRHDFAPESIFTWNFAATVPFRPLMVVAYAALIVVVTRGGGWLVERIAAAGRAAFTNYLGTSILMTGLFYGWGLGLYGSLGRAELYLVVFAMWAIILLWSKPWLERFNYGPFEWLWRSLSHGRPQPMLKRREPSPAPA